MTDLKRIADALEHLAWSQIAHETGCAICKAKRKPIKKMPVSTVMNSTDLRKREAEIRTQKMLHGPEQPVGDMFRYRELEKKP